MLIDAHNHLHDQRFQGQQEQIIKAMRSVGIQASVVNGTSEHDWPEVASLFEQHPDFIIPSFGLHPWKVKERSAHWLGTLRSYLEQYPNSKLGECGLDRWIKDPDFEAQQDCFEAQLSLAHELNRPITIHCLKAWGLLLDILRQASALPPFLIHSFGGSAEVGRELADLGAYFSFSGHFLHQRKSAQFDIFKTLPHDRILLETDAPDMLPPADYQSHPLESLNHPANLPKIAVPLLTAMQLDGQQISKNTRNFLKL